MKIEVDRDSRTLKDFSTAYNITVSLTEKFHTMDEEESYDLENAIKAKYEKMIELYNEYEKDESGKKKKKKK